MTGRAAAGQNIVDLTHHCKCAFLCATCRPACIPAAGACIVELPVPYELPPQRYQASDEPWRVGEAFSGLDSQGCTIQESFECNSHYGHEEPDG